MTNAAPPRKAGFTSSPRKAARTPIAVGRKLAELLKPPQLLLLRGDLGTGKTTLVKGIAQALDAAEPDEVTSPTFTLIHEYDGSRNGKPVKLLPPRCLSPGKRAPAGDAGPRRSAHAGCAGAGGVGREVQEHPQAGHRRNRDRLRRRRRAQDHRDAEGIASRRVSESASRRVSRRTATLWVMPAERGSPHALLLPSHRLIQVHQGTHESHSL